MKIHIDGVNFSSRSGPNSFGTRLAKKLFETGHEVLVDDGTNADVSLVFIEPTGRPLAKRIVQRLDGIWFHPNDFETKNVGIKNLYLNADAVVFQSEFDRKMITHWWGAPHNTTVIRNGIDTQHVKVSNTDLLGLRGHFKKIFVCSANWHPQKRLRANVDFFLDQLKQEPNSCLIVMGANPDVRIAHPKIFYTGSIPHELCLEVYRIADWMVHLAWLDHAPNVVIESLSQETPIICSSEGGTKELIKQFGIVVNESNYDFELVDYDKPPHIEVTNIHLPPRDKLGEVPNVSIDNIVERYIGLFESIC